MKKHLLTALILGSASIAAANQYNIIISKEHNDYEKKDLTIVRTEVSNSEWFFLSETNCSNVFDSSDFYYDKDFLQTKTCDETQERTVTTTHFYSNNSSKDVITTETQTVYNKQTNLTEKGTHIESSCKDILDFDLTLDDDSYYIDHNGGMTVDCDMNTDGGGWTKITTANVIHSGGYADYTFSDSGFTYSEALFVDNGNVGDFATPTTNNYYDWTGYHLAWNAVQLDNVWYNTATGSPIPGDINNKLPLSRFTVLENASTTCYQEINIVDTFCANKVIIDTAGARISGISDTQSLSSAALQNNYFAMKFFIYIR